MMHVNSICAAYQQTLWQNSKTI